MGRNGGRVSLGLLGAKRNGGQILALRTEVLREPVRRVRLLPPTDPRPPGRHGARRPSVFFALVSSQALEPHRPTLTS